MIIDRKEDIKARIVTFRVLFIDRIMTVCFYGLKASTLLVTR